LKKQSTKRYIKTSYSKLQAGPTRGRMRGALYPGPTGAGPGKVKALMMAFSVIKPKILLV